MATQTAPTPVIDDDVLTVVVQRAVEDLSAGYGGVMVLLGHRLGLYRAMSGRGALTPAELARAAGCAERYVREWLNAQAAGGYVEYEPTTERYTLTPEQATVLADQDSPVFIPDAWQVPLSMFLDLDRAAEAFTTGAGIAWGEHDAHLYCGVASFYRNAYRASLVNEWLPALDGVVECLAAGGRVADVGCGHGHSTIVMAQAFPDARFHGFDAHADSIAAATRNAVAAGVADRVSFTRIDARSLPGAEYDLVCFFDCLHDMGDPVGAAAAAREALAPNGTLMLVEPFAGDRVEQNLNPIGRLYYAASTTLCCAHAISEGGPLALGAQAGESALREVCERAGFTRFRRAAETPFNLILEARP